MTAKARRQFRVADLADPATAAKGMNDVLLDIYRRLEAEEAELQGVRVTINNLTPTALALAAVGSVPNANGASVSYSDPTYTLTLQPTDGTSPGVISAANQTINRSGVVLTFNGQCNHDDIIRLNSTRSIQFNGSSTHYIRYLGNVLTGMNFGGDNFEFVPNSASGQLYYPEKAMVDRLGYISKDDHSGTTGSFTTTAHAGRASIAAGATGLVITNNTASRAFAATDDVFWSWIDDDATATGMKVVAAANTITFTIAGGLTATANTRFAWWVLK